MQVGDGVGQAAADAAAIQLQTAGVAQFTGDPRAAEAARVQIGEQFQGGGDVDPLVVGAGRPAAAAGLVGALQAAVGREGQQRLGVCPLELIAGAVEQLADQTEGDAVGGGDGGALGSVRLEPAQVSLDRAGRNGVGRPPLASQVVTVLGAAGLQAFLARAVRGDPFGGAMTTISLLKSSEFRAF